MTLAAQEVLAFVADLSWIVARSQDPESLPDVAQGLAASMRRFGIPVDRLQLPLSFLFGLRHPLYAGIVLTWSDTDGSSAWLRHRRPDQRDDAIATLRKSPFAAVALDGEPFVHLTAGTKTWSRYPLLMKLGASGFTDYVATAAPLPDGARQVVSIATRRAGGFDADVPERLQQIAPVLALALYGLYQAQSVRQIASTYIGRRAGARVVEGELGRGTSEAISAAIAFVDVRGFTGLCDEMGAEGVVPLLNAVFEAVDRTTRRAGGEILKLMGDAALVVFPADPAGNVACEEVIGALLDAADAVHDATDALGHPLRVAIGLHFGEVQYGNVGSERRRDFTVMGSAVNRAARLEVASKQLGATLVASAAFAAHCSTNATHIETRLDAVITERDAVSVPGIVEPVTLWSIERRAQPA